MDAIKFFNFVLRLAIWFLLTADFSFANIVIGSAIALLFAFLLPRNRNSLGALKDWLQILWEIVVAIPQAYIEAIEMIFRPHNTEDIICEQVKPNRTLGLIFLDIFLITFTPKTIVLKYHERGWYEVHRVIRRRKSRRRLR